MLSNQAAQRDMQLSNLIWQLKLRTERQFGNRDTLRVLMAEPERLDRLLQQAIASGDRSLYQLANDIQRLRDRSSEPGESATPWTWVIAIAIGALLMLGFALVFQTFSSREGATASWPQRTVLRMHGSNTVGENLAPQLIAGWLQANGATVVETQQLGSALERAVIGAYPLQRERRAVELFAHGSGTAFTDMGKGLADIGMSSRRVKPDEAKALESSFGNLRSSAGEHVVALDGLAVIVNQANPVRALTRDQVAALMSGAVSNWSAFAPGFDQPVQIHARDNKSGTFDTFESLVMKPSNRELAPGAQRYESSSELANAVAANPGAIGFVGLPYVGRTQALGIAEAPGAAPVVPTSFTVSTEDYPLSRRLYLYTSASAVSPEVESFVRYALSDQGQAVVVAAGLVSLNITAESVPAPAEAPADYKRLIASAQRLSLNFRFEAGAVELDTRGQRDLDRLVNYLSRDPNHAIMLFGFADGRVSEGDPVATSLSRAQHVAEALRARGVFASSVKGFGPALPVASDETEAGRLRNRRVEVWLR